MYAFRLQNQPPRELTYVFQYVNFGPKLIDIIFFVILDGLKMEICPPRHGPLSSSYLDMCNIINMSLKQDGVHLVVGGNWLWSGRPVDWRDPGLGSTDLVTAPTRDEFCADAAADLISCSARLC